MNKSNTLYSQFLKLRENLVCIHKNQILIDLVCFFSKVSCEILWENLWIAHHLCNYFFSISLVGTYLDAIDSLSILVLFSPTKLGLGFMLGGIILLTVGIVGIIWQYFKNRRKLLSALAIIFIPSLTFFTMFFACISVFVFPYIPMRGEITQVTVVDASPLVLSLGVKAITGRDSRIDSAFILDSNDTLVASCFNEEILVNGIYTDDPICVLPAGSEVTVTVDFNATLPSGSYIVRLYSWHDNHGESLFTIP